VTTRLTQRLKSPVIRRNTVRTVETGPEQHAWAGGAAGLVAGFLLYPAETISMRYKVGGQSVLKNLVSAFTFVGEEVYSTNKR